MKTRADSLAVFGRSVCCNVQSQHLLFKKKSVIKMKCEIAPRSVALLDVERTQKQ